MTPVEEQSEGMADSVASRDDFDMCQRVDQREDLGQLALRVTHLEEEILAEAGEEGTTRGMAWRWKGGRGVEEARNCLEEEAQNQQVVAVAEASYWEVLAEERMVAEAGAPRVAEERNLQEAQQWPEL